MLAIKNLTKSFGTKKVLNNVSLSVKRGEIAVASGARVIYLFTPEEFERVKSQVQQKK